MAYYVYILKNPDDRFYIGQTSDLNKRLERHNSGKVFWTKARGPWELAHRKEFPDRSEAISEERLLKKLRNRKTIEARVAQW